MAEAGGIPGHMWLVSCTNSHWSIKVNEIKSPICLFCNCVQLDHSDLPVTLTLVDTYTHFEAHVNIDVSTENEFNELCSTVFVEVHRVMFEGIHRATLNLNYPIMRPNTAFVMSLWLHAPINVANAPLPSSRAL